MPMLGSIESSEQLIRDLYIDLRAKIAAWAGITHQTAQARMGYIGQHLVSVVTGFPGGKSGARGRDLIISPDEYGEVKTCYRVDQLGKCRACTKPVSPLEAECSNCGSDDIERKNDSKWLIGIQHDEEYGSILDPQHYYFVLFEFTDYRNPNDIEASIWQVDPKRPGFALALADYYLNIRSKSSSGAPLNLWPHRVKFLLCRPSLIYKSFIRVDGKIDTVLFPGRDQPQEAKLDLLAHKQSTNLTVDSLQWLTTHLRVPGVMMSKSELATAIADMLERSGISQDWVDAFSVELYRPLLEKEANKLPGEAGRYVRNLLRVK